jgi:hypothetical protein
MRLECKKQVYSKYSAIRGSGEREREREREREYPIMKMQKLAKPAKSDSCTSFLKSHQPWQKESLLLISLILNLCFNERDNNYLACKKSNN